MSIDPLVDNAVNRVRKELITRTDAISTSITNLPTLIPSDITRELTLVAGEDLTANIPVRLDSDGKVRRSNTIIAQGEELPLHSEFYPIIAFKTQSNNKIVVVYQSRNNSTSRRRLFYSVFDSNLNIIYRSPINPPVALTVGESFSVAKSLGANNTVGIASRVSGSGVRFFSFTVDDTTNLVTVNAGASISINANAHQHSVCSDSTGRFILAIASDATSVSVATFSSNAVQSGTTQSIATVRSGVSAGVCSVAFDSASSAAYLIVSSASNTAKCIKLTYQTDSYAISGSQVTLTGSVNHNYEQDNRWATVFDNKVFTEYSQGSGQFSLVAVDITGGTINATAQILQSIVPFINGFDLTYRGRVPFVANNKFYFIDKTSNNLVEIVSSVGSIRTSVAGKISTACAKTIYTVESATVYAAARVFNLGSELILIDNVQHPYNSSITNNMPVEILLSTFKNITDVTTKQNYNTLGTTNATAIANANIAVSLSPENMGILQTRTNTGKVIGSSDVDGSIIISSTQSLLPLKTKRSDAYLARAATTLRANSLAVLEENGMICSAFSPKSTALVSNFTNDGASLVFSFRLNSGNIFSLSHDGSFNGTNQMVFSVTNPTGDRLASGLFAYTFHTSNPAYAFKNATGTNLFGMMAKANGAAGTREFALFSVNEARLQPFQSGNATSPIEQIGSVTSFIQTEDGPVSITYDPTRSLFIGVARGRGDTENPRVSTFNLSGVRVGTEQTISGFTGANNLNQVLGLEYDSLSDACYLIANGGASTANLYVAKLTYQTDAFKLSGSVTTVTTPSGFASGGQYAVGYPSSTILNQMIFCKRTSSNANKVFAVSVAGGTINTTGFTLEIPSLPGLSIAVYGSYLCSTGNELLLPFSSDTIKTGFFRICPSSLSVTIYIYDVAVYSEQRPTTIVKLSNNDYLLGYSSGAVSGVTGRALRLDLFDEESLLAPYNIPGINYPNKVKAIGRVESLTSAKGMASIKLFGDLSEENNLSRRFASVRRQKVYLNDNLTLNKKVNYNRLRVKSVAGTTVSSGASTTLLNLFGSRGGIIDYVIFSTPSGGGSNSVTDFRVIADGDLEYVILGGSAMTTQSSTSYLGNANVFPLNIEFTDSINLRAICGASSISFTVFYREEV
jgi:hypothetical protein